jgi:glycosyltransferase involved in cell wall biosynthesis
MDRIISSGKTGLLVPAADPLSLSEGIELFLSQLRSGLLSRAAIRASVKHLSWENVAAAMAEEYTGAIQRSCPGFIPDAADQRAAYGI